MSNDIYVGDGCLATVEEDIIAVHYCGMCGVCVCAPERERERGKEKTRGDTSKASFSSTSDVFLQRP